MKFIDIARTCLLITTLATPARAGSDDVWLTANAKMAILTTAGLNVKDIHVAVTDGVVTLHGAVKTGSEKDRAGSVVAAVPGVKSVTNRIRLSPQDFDGDSPLDDKVRRNVEAALRADGGLEGVRVGSVENGVVLLEGATPSPEEKLRAIEVAWAVSGVSRVASRIECGK